MLTQCAVVIKHLPEAIELATTRPTACARCAEGRGCGGGIFGLLAGGEQSQLLRLPMAHPERYMPGHRVTVALPGRALLSLAALVYGVPLLALIVGAWLGQSIGGVVGAGASLQAGWSIGVSISPVSAWPALVGAIASLGITVTVLARFAPRLQAHLLLNQLRIVDEAGTTA